MGMSEFIQNTDYFIILNTVLQCSLGKIITNKLLHGSQAKTQLNGYYAEQCFRNAN